MADHPQDATAALSAHTEGRPVAASRLLPLVYDELRRLAARYMARERREHTLQPTALVHEAYVRLIDGTRVDWQGKTHFFAIAAIQMRRVLVEHARSRKAQKRGGDRCRVSLNSGIAAVPDELDMIQLDEALGKLAQESPRQERVVELRFFGGLSVTETAQVLEVSERTVKRDWRKARAFLYRALGTPSLTTPDA